MTQREFAKKLLDWRKEFLEDVTKHYAAEHRDRGEQAYQRWQERFTLFLRRHAPNEARRFQTTTGHLLIVRTTRSRPLDEFMEGRGDTCLGFIDTLVLAGQQRKIIGFRQAGDAVKSDVEIKDRFIDETRMREIKLLKSQQFDLSKLIRICEELNLCYANNCFLAVAMLVRSMLDHVPPVFGYQTFSEVANNYSTGGKSFKDSMQHLDKSLRKIADAHLHGQIRQKESLPNRTQINFRNDVDVLLAEVARIV